MNRIRTLLLLCSAALASPALAATDAVCWNRDTERMDFYSNPPTRGDNNFFSFTVSGTANVTMIYPASMSMKQLPVSLYELKDASVAGVGTLLAPDGQGCQNVFLNNLDYFMPGTVEPPAAAAAYSGAYDKTKRYPEPESTYAGGGGLADNFEIASYNDKKTASDGGRAWRYLLWPANDSGTAESIDTACTTPTTGAAYVADDRNDCKLCVQTKGYWINYKIADQASNSSSAMVVKGNWLNFYPPKWAILRLAYKRLVNGPLLNTLREGIGTQNGTQGWYRLQKMLPQSCTGQGRPNQRIGSVDTVTYNNTSNPLAEALFNVAWTVSSQDSTPPATWSFFTSQSTHPSSEDGIGGESGKKSGFCPGCNAGFSVLFSDGRGIDGWPNCDGAANVATHGYCKVAGAAYDSHAACSGVTTSGSAGVKLGTEDDGNDYLDPNIANGAAALISGSGATYRTTSSAVCANDLLPSVAAWMFATNLGGTPGTNLRLYTVGVGDNYFGELEPLRLAASAGHGLFLTAANFAQLERNIEQVFLDIISNATSFSVAAITTVQTRGTTFAFIPRFRPLGGSQWEGRLYRFRLYNEFAAGCSIADLTANDGGPVKNAVNPNGNDSCTDLYLMESDGGVVGEDDGGSFALLDSTQAYGDAGWPLKSPSVLAQPIWEAAALLDTRVTTLIGDGGGVGARNILVAPMDGGIPSAGTNLITFNNYSSANVATMTDYMKLSGVNSDFCVGMGSTSRHAYTTEQECATDLIKFVEGRDVLRQNFDGGVARPNILGDIFHSSPILVTPPVPQFLCETGIITQCVRTLYAEDSPNGFTPNSKNAYTTYYNDKLARQELIVVGANDGMLHAFHAGNYQADARTFDDGTGQEVWAFIPPDLVPKLQRYALSSNHSILLDGSPWVRDIWKDGSGATSADHQKQSDEFHTVVIVGEREGGRYYTAIDVTDTASNPKYLWTWPPPGSNYALASGETWNDTTPNPPPVGPVLIQDNSGPITVTAGGSSVRASERWVAALSGGFDPNYIRGRAVYVVDAWDGTLLYKFSRYDTSSSSDPRFLLGSVLAPVSMIDSNYDNFFDLAVVGDTEGQVWTIDMLNPGNISSGLVNNWYGGLTFQQFKGGVISQRAPFTTMAGARVFDDAKGGVRVYLGSGDRDQIKVRDTDSADGGTCALDNLRGCVRNNCTVDVNQATYQIGDGGTVEAMTGRWKYTASGTSLTTNSFTLGSNTNTAGACDDWTTVNIQYQNSCAGTAMADPNTSATTIVNTMNCNFDGGTDAGEECLDTAGKPVDQPGVAFTSPAITNTRFYAMKLFDAPNYTSRPRMTSPATQTTYNTSTNTLTDTNLTDVSGDAGMSSSAAGWFVQQSRDQNEKTVTAPLLLGGCVAWNTEVPSVLFSGSLADGGSVCNGGVIPSDTAYLY